jgi:hypothetical protein
MRFRADGPAVFPASANRFVVTHIDLLEIAVLRQAILRFSPGETASCRHGREPVADVRNIVEP